MLISQKQRSILRILASVLAVAVLAGMSVNANAGLIKSYDFNGNLSDTLGNGDDLTASGGTIGGGRYSFSDNEGLILTNALPSTTDYGIELRFQMDSQGDWNKLIDFQDLTSDYGLYVREGELDFTVIYKAPVSKKVTRL